MEIRNIETDRHLALQIKDGLRRSWLVPHRKLKVKVEKKVAIIEGALDWEYQRALALKVARKTEGIKNVVNRIKIRSEIEDAIEKEAIQRLISKNWRLKDKIIDVRVIDDTVYLTGIVSSVEERADAERIAWSVYGVWNVENYLVVD